MLKNRNALIVKSAVIVAAVPILIMASRTGPVVGASGVPGEGDCTRCHSGPGPSPGGGVEISFSGGGSSYQPGVSQTLTVRVNEPATNARLFGFQMTARLASNVMDMAGTFSGSGLLSLCGSRNLQTEIEKTAGGCSGNTPLEYISHKEASSERTFTLTWTPPADNVGEVRIFVAANAANGSQTESGDRIYNRSYTLTPQASGARPTIASGGIVNAFSGRPNLASGEWILVFGTNLAPGTRTWAQADFNGNNAPTQLDGVRVLINGQPSVLNYISPGQVNAQVPTSADLGNVRIEVVTPSGTSEAATLSKDRAAPGLLAPADFLVGGTQYVVAFHSDATTFVGRPNLIAGANFRPARPGDTIILYGVGFGPTDPEVPSGQIVTGTPRVTLPLQVRFGSTVANVAFAGLVPGFLGLYQFNLEVPNVADGDHQLQAEVGGISTGQTLFITTQR